MYENLKLGSLVQGRIKDPRDFEQVPVAVRNGIALRLGQLARIEDTQEEERDAAYNEACKWVEERLAKQRDAIQASKNAAGF